MEGLAENTAFLNRAWASDERGEVGMDMVYLK